MHARHLVELVEAQKIELKEKNVQIAQLRADNDELRENQSKIYDKDMKNIEINQQTRLQLADERERNKKAEDALKADISESKK